MPRSKTGDVPFFRSAALRCAEGSRLIGGLAEQDRAGVADQPGPVGGDLQSMVPPVMLHREERSSPGNVCVVTANLPGPGRSSPSNREGTAASRPSLRIPVTP